MNRKILNIVNSKTTVEGAGVKLKRVIGNQGSLTLDPFLLFDHIASNQPEDYISGFPWHPHRGIETITYMWTGKVKHGDSTGNQGVIESGDVQWMTAGSGIIHEEMPQPYQGLVQGFQLWVNLPASKKMINPKYRGIKKDQLATLQTDNAKIIIIAGKIDNVQGPVSDLAVDVEYFDVELAARKTFEHMVPKNNTVLIYIVEGEVAISQMQVIERQCAILGPGDIASVSTLKGSRFLFLSGAPIGEPVAWGGPIVMNTQRELTEAFKELELGIFIKNNKPAGR